MLVDLNLGYISFIIDGHDYVYIILFIYFIGIKYWMGK